MGLQGWVARGETPTERDASFLARPGATCAMCSVQSGKTRGRLPSAKQEMRRAGERSMMPRRRRGDDYEAIGACFEGDSGRSAMLRHIGDGHARRRRGTDESRRQTEKPGISRDWPRDDG